jgi:hypothetical protein
MQRTSLIVIAQVCFGLTAARGSDATTPVDYTQRNAPFAPGASVTPDKKAITLDTAVADKRVDKTIIDKQPAAVGDRRAAIDVTETRAKTVRDKDSRRPEAVEEPRSAFDHREASISTADDTKRPPLVTKYQDSLKAASATNMARFPALDHATTAKINRFVFRKNSSEPSAVTPGAAVTPAAGGSLPQK